jgi:adenylate kinase
LSRALALGRRKALFFVRPAWAHPCGYLFDGFPRTIPQAEALREAGVTFDFVLEIDVDDQTVIERLSGRRVHTDSGRVYHIQFNLPQMDGRDDETGEALVQPDDDREDTVRRRLAIYHEQTAQLIGFYGAWAQSGAGGAPAYRKVKGVGLVDAVRATVFCGVKLLIILK